MINLAVLSNPKRKKRKVKRTVKRNAARKVTKRKKRTVKRHAPVKQIKKRHKRQIKGVKKMVKKHKKSHRKAHRSNPMSKAFSMVKRSNITGVAIDTAMVAGGFIGQGMVQDQIGKFFPAYTTMERWPKALVNVGAAIGLPMILSFILPMAGIKKSDALKVSKYVGLGMLSSVVATEVKTSMVPLGAITSSLPASRSYGLAAAPKTVVNKIPTYLL